MLTVDEIIKSMELKYALGIPFPEGSCFGVTDSRELRDTRMAESLKETEKESKEKARNKKEKKSIKDG
ncbi:hypothetical protein KKD04_01340 [Patescibacteria group bacterium]|nr:hypothetical protein [Patescibacteria group bacterium]